MTSATYDERRAKAEAMRAVWPVLAAELGKMEPAAGWKLETFPQDGSDDRQPHRIVNTAGEGVYFRYDEYKHRVSFSGDLGQRADGRQWIRRDLYGNDWPENPNPTMSADKTPAEWAKDIGRRLLPDYRILRAECQRRNGQTQQAIQGADAFADRAASLCPAFRLRKRDQMNRGDLERHLDIQGANSGPLYGDVRISDASVQFDLRSVKPAAAERILRTIADCIAEYPGSVHDEN